MSTYTTNYINTDLANYYYWNNSASCKHCTNETIKTSIVEIKTLSVGGWDAHHCCSIAKLDGYCEVLQQELQGVQLTSLCPDPMPQLPDEGSDLWPEHTWCLNGHQNEVVAGVKKGVLLDLCLLCLASHQPCLSCCKGHEHIYLGS